MPLEHSEGLRDDKSTDGPQQANYPPGGIGGSRLYCPGDIDSAQHAMTKMIAAPPNMTQGAAAPLTSVAPTTTTSTPVKRNLGHQRVRRVRARRAALR